MSNTFDIHQRAQELRSKHQNNIDKQLKRDMSQALHDTKSFVQQRLNIISNDMETEIEQTQQSLQDSIQRKKTSLQANIEQVGANVSKDVKTMQESLQTQIERMNQDLQTLRDLSQVTEEQAKLKKVLFSSNIALALITLILLISSIWLGYVSKNTYNDINEMQSQVDYLKSQGGSMFTTQCKGRLCVELDPSVEEEFALENGTRPLGVVKELR